jgi:hypothetical protein
VAAVSHSRFRCAVLAAAYAFSIYVFIRLPSLVGLGPGPVAIPWPQRALTAFFFPTAALIILLIFKSIMSRDPFRENYPRFRRTFELLLDVATVLIVGVHLTLLGKLGNDAAETFCGLGVAAALALALRDAVRRLWPVEPLRWVVDAADGLRN